MPLEKCVLSGKKYSKKCVKITIIVDFLFNNSIIEIVTKV